MANTGVQVKGLKLYVTNQKVKSVWWRERFEGVTGKNERGRWECERFRGEEKSKTRRTRRTHKEHNVVLSSLTSGVED
jgi:hypothetical protein